MTICNTSANGLKSLTFLTTTTITTTTVTTITTTTATITTTTTITTNTTISTITFTTSTHQGYFYICDIEVYVEVSSGEYVSREDERGTRVDPGSYCKIVVGFVVFCLSRERQ